MLDLAAIRSRFPALQAESPPIFLDGPGGTQVPRQVIDAVTDYLIRCNANHGGAFSTSRLSDAILDEARLAVAEFLNAPSESEIVFGQNMTSLTFHLSRSLAREWRPGDVVLVTRLDHDANVRPWILAAQDVGAEVRFVEIRADGTLDEEDFQRKLDGKVRLFALTCASNAIGTIPNVAALTRQAQQAGALVFLDAVHYAPHLLIDVHAWGCDFLACSAYKFFGPHVGILWGKRRHLERLPAYKVRPASDSIPDRWMTGTQNHEGIAGVRAAIDYLASLGHGSTRREQLVSAMTSIQEYETQLIRKLLSGLGYGWRVWGLTNEDDFPRRCPTLAITHAFRSPREIVERLAERDVFAWSGNFYAVELAEALGVESHGGFVRLGLVHYNTEAEVQRTLSLLDEIGR